MQTNFELEPVNAVRELAQNARRIPGEGQQGWSISDTDPNALLSVFEPLKLRPDYTLRAYQFRSDRNGNGVVWAMKKDAWFPAPDVVATQLDDQLQTPRPAGSLDNVMEAIEGDGNPWSYLSASLFAREAAEFGALWHGCSWSDHQIIGENPAEQEAMPEPPSADSQKKWHWEFCPQSWLPCCVENERDVIVEFYTYRGVMPEGLYRHRDTYTAHNYAFRSKLEVVAVGPGGYVH